MREASTTMYPMVRISPLLSITTPVPSRSGPRSSIEVASRSARMRMRTTAPTASRRRSAASTSPGAAAEGSDGGGLPCASAGVAATNASSDSDSASRITPGRRPGWVVARVSRDCRRSCRRGPAAGGSASLPRELLYGRSGTASIGALHDNRQRIECDTKPGRWPPDHALFRECPRRHILIRMSAFQPERQAAIIQRPPAATKQEPR